MKSIERQLADYFELQDELHPEITPEEVAGSAVRVSTPVRSTSNPWWAAAAAAIVVLAIGTVALLAVTRPGGVPAEQPATPTTAVEPALDSATTTLTDPPESVVTTTTPERVISYEQMEAPNVVSETTTRTSEFGEVTWTRYEAPNEAVPHGGILFEPGVGFVSYPQFNSSDPRGSDRQYEWRSDDGVSWQRRALPEFDGYEGVSIQSGWKSQDSDLGLWATAWSSSTSEFMVASGDTWVPVTFDGSSRPTSDGMVFEILWGEPVSTDDVTLFATSGQTRLPWESYFGDGSPDSLSVEWDDTNRKVTISNADSGLHYANMDVTVDGSDVAFIDAATGDVVHEVTATDGVTVDMVLESIEGRRVGDLWVADRDGTLRWIPNPVPGNAFDWGIPIEALPTGGFVAYEELPEDHFTFWASQDGETWTEVGSATFPVQGQGGTTISAWAGGLRADVGSETAPHYVMESVDGATWHEAPSAPSLGEMFDTAFGHVVIGFGPVDGELLLSASKDGATWESIEVPPDLAQPRISGGYFGGAAGDMYYLVIVADSGEVHYWTGRFE